LSRGKGGLRGNEVKRQGDHLSFFHIHVLIFAGLGALFGSVVSWFGFICSCDLPAKILR
jgi:hypothetical protein